MFVFPLLSKLTCYKVHAQNFSRAVMKLVVHQRKKAEQVTDNRNFGYEKMKPQAEEPDVVFCYQNKLEKI